MNRLCDLSIDEVTEGIRNQHFTAEEYVSQTLERIAKIDVDIKAFVRVNTDDAIESARRIDNKIHKGEEVGYLAGITVGIKDNISTKGLRTTCASRILLDYIPPYDATVIRKLKECDAIVIGKLNLDEFAMGSTTEFSKFGPTRNPWNLDYVTGGSSGGSAAAVAAAECTASLGSDTGGSVRCPASFCSVVGFKPTYGSVSRYGLIAYSNSLEQVGPIARTVPGVIRMMNAISGADPNDDTTRTVNTPYSTEASTNRLRIALLSNLTVTAQPEVSKCIYSAMDTLSSAGCICEEISLDSLEYALASYYVIAMAEASSNLARYDNIRYGFEMDPEGYDWNSYFSKVRSNFGEEVKRRIIIGTYVLSSGYYGRYYLKAQKVRALLRREFKSLYSKYDVIIAPTMPILPFRIGEKIDDPIKIYYVDIDTVVSNLTGMPAISVPAGFSNGLPIGLQIMSDEFKEQKIFDAALLFERTAKIPVRAPL
ncbi:MAG: Asp-tRNA(Asn)/Glu-tRNA(Gln) amidotransferase subunit GatA [Nitrososphaeraceae archaeon]